MNLSRISDKSFLGRILRFLLRLIPSSLRIPIFQGRLRGKKWIACSYNHGCWLGSYEYQGRLLFEKVVKLNQVVFDLGAHVGYYTLLASELVGPNGKVIAFEPLPRNVQYLKEHVRLNRCKNVEIIEAAVWSQTGTSSFVKGKNYSYGFLSREGKFQVKTISMDDFIEEHPDLVPDFIKIDIEGGEFFALLGAKKMLTRHLPVLFLETHSIALNFQCRNFLASLGYDFHSIDGKTLEQSVFLFAFSKRGPLK